MPVANRPRHAMKKKSSSQTTANGAMSDAIQGLLRSTTLRRHLDAGDVLYAHGETVSACYVIESGMLEAYVIERGHRRYSVQLSSGDVVGAIDFILARPYSRHVEALSPTTVHVLTPDVLTKQLNSVGPLAFCVMQSLARNIDGLSPGGRS